MAPPTLAQYVARQDRPVIQAVGAQMVDSDQLWQVLPFVTTPSRGIEYNLQDSLGGAQVGDGNFTAFTNAGRNSATTTQVTVDLTEIFGQVQLGAVMMNDPTERMKQFSSRSKKISDGYIEQFVGDGTTTNHFKGLDHVDIIPAAQKIDHNGAVLTLDALDGLIFQCNPQPEYLVMHRKHVMKLRSLLRAANGGTITETRELPNGRRVMGPAMLHYNGVIVLINDNIPDETVNSQTTKQIYALAMDDGTRTRGVAGVTKDDPNGLTVSPAAPSEDNSGTYWNLCFLGALANFNNTAAAALNGVRL